MWVTGPKCKSHRTLLQFETSERAVAAAEGPEQEVKLVHWAGAGAEAERHNRRAALTSAVMEYTGAGLEVVKKQESTNKGTGRCGSGG